MKLKKIVIDGYGRLSDRLLEFVPGLQVIMGPNEQGKSTIRCFIADMLYGQKRSTVKRSYEESNKLRTPWQNPKNYGGTLVYELSNGHEIEVARQFSRENESLQVFDRTLAREITGDFKRLRNREVDFAPKHLGLRKEVFLGTATINHVSLENLGDQDALIQIREKIMALADSGNETQSADTALKRLATRIAAIGQPTARTKPLPTARVEMRTLDKELDQARALQLELAETGDERRGILEEIAQLRERRRTLENDLHAIEAHERMDRLKEAELLRTRIDAATQHCFALGAVREFPLELSDEVQQAANRLAAAQAQHDRTRTEYDQLNEQMRAERLRLGNERAEAPEELPEEMATRFNTLSAEVRHVGERLNETDALVEAAEARLAEAQDTITEMPDFNRLAPAPVEWITQLASSFSVAVNSRNEECEKRDALREEIRKCREALAETEPLFEDCEDFPDMAREYELRRRAREDRTIQHTMYLQTLEGTREEVAERIPGFVWLTIFCAMALCALLFGFYVTQKTAIFYAVGLLTIAMLWFLSNIFVTRARLRRLNREMDTTQDALVGRDGDAVSQPGFIDDLLARTGCETTRELEALHEEYRTASVELSAQLNALESQEARATEAEERVPQLLAHFRKTFAQIGETIADEDDMQSAAGRAIARYQDYREAKRRVSDSRSVLERHQAEQKRLANRLIGLQEELAALETEIRAFMQSNGFEDERDHETLDGALHAYRNVVVGHREQHGRIEVLGEKFQNMESQREREAAEVGQRQEELDRLFEKAAVTSMDGWEKKARQAKEYREVWAKRGALEEQLKAVLRGEDIDALREGIDAEVCRQPLPEQGREGIKQALDSLAETIDARMKEEHALHIGLTERSAGMRSINEIEEEREAVSRQIEVLELEHEATSRAMVLIEDVARDKHARIAPQLAESAGQYLADITDGAYNELLISRDLDISVRIPQTRKLNEEPKKVLSKGTVDQVYFALRLALIQGISETGESVPMLLDDPFGNYDDARLERTLRLIADMGEGSQILLFTCREDIVRIAKSVKAHVIRL